MFRKLTKNISRSNVFRRNFSENSNNASSLLNHVIEVPTTGKSVWGRFVVPESKTYGVYNPITGKYNTITGPSNQWYMSFRTIFELTDVTLDPENFVKVRYKNGDKEIIKGSDTAIFTPNTDMLTYEVRKNVSLDNNEYAILTMIDGSKEVINGPTSRQLGFDVATYVRKEKRVIPENEYVKVYYNDPEKNNEIIMGPCVYSEGPDVEKISVYDKTTVETNQFAIIKYLNGDEKIIKGPKTLVRDFDMTQIDVHENSSAQIGKFAHICYNDGTEEIINGPCEVNYTSKMSSIEIKDGIKLDGQESLIVYTDSNDNVTRDIIKGPDVWIPKVIDSDGNKLRQWVHNFSVHGSKYKEYDRGVLNVKVPGALNFTKLRLVPSMMYLDTMDTRTNDDALLTIRSVLYYEITDVEKLLDGTYDHTADLINATSACTNQYVSTRSFDKFKTEIDGLNDLSQYDILVQKGKEIGINVTKVVCNGYIAPDAIQEMQNRSLETQTRLQIEYDEETQKQELQDLILERDTKRSEEKMDLEKTQQNHKLGLIFNEEEAQRRKIDEDHKLEYAYQSKINDELIRMTEHETEQMELRSKVVDLTAIEVAKATQPPEKRYEFVDAPGANFKNEFNVNDQ